MSANPNKDASLRIAVLLSGGGSTLANLVARIADGRLRRVEIARVISSRANVGGLRIAGDAGLPAVVVARRDFSDLGTYSDALTEAIGSPDLVVMGGFLTLWRIPGRWHGRVLNIHPALLPAFGGRGMYGRHVHEAVLAAGVSESGCTVHLADDQYDHGPNVAFSRVPVRADDTPETLAGRVVAAERELYPWVLQQVANEGPAWLRRTAEAGGVPYPAV